MSTDTTWYQTVKDAIADLHEQIQYNIDSGDLDPFDPDRNLIHDLIFQAADSGVPVYTSDLIALAHDDLSLATDTPELGPAFDGSPTPENIIAANVFEQLEGELWEYWWEIEDFEELEIAIKIQAFEGLGL